MKTFLTLLALLTFVPGQAFAKDGNRYQREGGITVPGGGGIALRGGEGDLIIETGSSVLIEDAGALLIGGAAFQVPLTLFLAGTLGNDAGNASDGVLIGVITDGAAICFQDDGAVFTDYTTECVSGNGDIIMLPVVAEAGDAFYIGHATLPFVKVSMDTTNGVQGSTVMDVVWEYPDSDSTWATLNFARQDVVDFDEAVGAHINTFLQPSDWTAIEVNSVEGYYIRMRVDAFTSSTTDATADIITVGPTTTGTGFTIPFTATLVTVGFTAATVSGTNDDTGLLLMNLTQGTQTVAIFSKTTIVDHHDMTDLAFAAGDELVVLQLAEDGTTEHANVNLVLHLER